MYGNSENLRDTEQNSIKDNVSASVLYGKKDIAINSYPKLNKLITALYIVTDIIDKDEPIRIKLRTLGVEILLDINHLSRTEINSKVHSILSFLDISLAINLISEMNFGILKKEFIELNNSFKTEAVDKVNHLWLEEFLKTKEPYINKLESPKYTQNDIQSNLENKDQNTPNIFKKQRREDIILAIRENGDSATITDVKNKARGALLTCGEKTLQRELISMVKDGILQKVGSKRWSKYLIV